MESLTWYAYQTSLYLRVYYTIKEGNPSTITIDDVVMYSSYRQEEWRFDGTITVNGTTIGSSFYFPTHTFDEKSTNSGYTKTISVASTSNVAFTVNGTFKYVGSGNTAAWQTIDNSTQNVNVHVYAKHTLSINQGTGSSITVNRTSSSMTSTGALTNGATIYEGDKLTITFTIGTGYNLTGHTVNGSSFTSGNSYTVPASLSNNKLQITTTTTVKSYTLSVSVGTGSTIVVNRTSSPKQGAATGNLSNGATIYYSDILKISLSANTGYNVGTLKVNSSTFTSGNSHTVTDNVAVSSTASVKSYKLSISAGTGSTITVNRTSSPKQGAGTGALSNGATIYYSDVLKITFASSPEYEILTHTVNSSAFTSGGSHTVTGAVAVATTTRILGIIYIDNGTTFEKYMVFIDNGTSWDQYIPYIDNGTGWDQYS